MCSYVSVPQLTSYTLGNEDIFPWGCPAPSFNDVVIRLEVSELCVKYILQTIFMA